MPSKIPKGQVNFTSYLRRSLKAIHPELGFNSQALLDLNSLCNTLARQVLHKSIELTQQKGQKTLYGETVFSASRLLFSGDLIESAIKASYEKDGKTVMVQIPVARAARFMKSGAKDKNFMGKTGLRIAGKTGKNHTSAASALAEVLNDFVYTLLVDVEPSSGRSSLIKATDLRVAAKENETISHYFRSSGIVLAHAGVDAIGVRDELQRKTTAGGKKKYKKRKGEVDGHRFRPGTVAIRDIKKLQKTDKMMLRKAPVDRLVRSHGEGMAFRSAALRAVQSYVETSVVSMLTTANEIAINGGRQTVNPAEIAIAKRSCGQFRGEDEDYSASTELSAGSIQRLARQAGVKRLGQASYDYVRGCIEHMIGMITDAAVIFAQNAGLKTVREEHIVHSIATVYGKKLAV